MEDPAQRILKALRAINEALEGRRTMQSMVYRDEPIIRRAADLLKPKAAPSAKVRLPRSFEQMRALASSPSAIYQSREELFFRQAQLMQDYTDDYVYRGVSIHYAPTYQSLNDEQLRGYFAWRTRYRNGLDEGGSADYYKLHLFELFHLIGASDPMDAYRQILPLAELLGAADSVSKRDTIVWIRDFILYYQLDLPLPGLDREQSFDAALQKILEPGEDAVSFLDGLIALSSYRFENSPVYKKDPAFCAQTVRRFYEALAAYYARNRRHTLEESLFGRQASVTYRLFRDAVFFDARPHPDHACAVSPYTVYRCRGRWWTVTRFQGDLQRNRQVGELLRGIDRVLREQLSDPHPLRDDGKFPKYAEALLLKVLKESRRSKKAAETPAAKPAEPLHFDLSGLDAIRQAADRTRDSLILEEEIAEAPELPAEPAPVPVGEPSASSLLTAEEALLLRLLLEGAPYEEVLQSRHLMLSVLVDSINDKLYDELADTAILFDGSRPEIIDDYREDLRRYIE